MSTVITTANDNSTEHSEHVGRLILRSQVEGPNTAAYPELDEKGYTLVRGVLSQEKASEYVDRAFEWLESFDKGFKRNDRSTWKTDNLPAFAWGGIFNRHGAQHEQWAWDIRSEPELIKVFANIWGTEKLLVSFDAVNISLPFDDDDTNVHRKPWPHVDQSPLRRFKHCIQGIMNLFEVGPKDGSLMVLEGSFELYNEFFETHEQDAPVDGWSLKDSYGHNPEQLQWFYDRGCTWKKIEAGPGDVILWDSRTIHYGAHAEGDRPRVATYVCYKPASQASDKTIELRKKLFKEGLTTSHDPIYFRQTGAAVLGKLTDDERTQPTTPPKLSHRALQLVGQEPY